MHRAHTILSRDISPQNSTQPQVVMEPTTKNTSSISSHILDTRTGKPASGVSVILERQVQGKAGEISWKQLAIGTTNQDGRVTSAEFPTLSEPGIHRAIFNTEDYFKATGVTDYFFPQVTVEFIVKLGGHFHIPLLLSPFGYSTYRGS